MIQRAADYSVADRSGSGYLRVIKGRWYRLLAFVAAGVSLLLCLFFVMLSLVALRNNRLLRREVARGVYVSNSTYVEISDGLVVRHAVRYQPAAPANNVRQSAQMRGLGFYFVVRRYVAPPRNPISDWELTVPPWILILLFALLPIYWVRMMKAWRIDDCCRFRICPKCGYDLRATPERCPECGEINAAPAAAKQDQLAA